LRRVVVVPASYCNYFSFKVNNGEGKFDKGLEQTYFKAQPRNYPDGTTKTNNSIMILLSSSSSLAKRPFLSHALPYKILPDLSIKLDHPPGVECGQRVGLTTLSPSISRLSK
jgi:hypothetical protein